MGLKAYMVHDGEPQENALLVFANTGQDARKAGYGHNYVGDYSFLDVRARRHPDADSLVRDGAQDAYVEHKLPVLRQAGWQLEGDCRCCHCDLATMDGDFPLCPDCERCSECGHEEDCPALDANQ